MYILQNYYNIEKYYKPLDFHYELWYNIIKNIKFQSDCEEVLDIDNAKMLKLQKRPYNYW